MGEVTKLHRSTGPALSRPSAILPSHDTSKFYCGHESLDDWLQNTALKAEGRSARTYVVCDGKIVVGYYCLATGSVTRSEAPSKVKRNMPEPIPVMILGRLAVTKHFERQGIGSGMLQDAFQRILQASESVGCRAVLVHAIDQSAAEFYMRYGFIEFPTGTKTFFLPLETIKQVL
jgi:predicted N-acetyltransferase YhbS